jgi:hypothetical protein
VAITFGLLNDDLIDLDLGKILPVAATPAIVLAFLELENNDLLVPSLVGNGASNLRRSDIRPGQQFPSS